jgi:hypothetical protein
MQSTTRLSLVVLAAAILLGAGVILADLYGPEPAPAFYNRSGIPVEILAVAGTSTVTRIDPASFEQYCLPPGVGPEKFLTTFWGMVVNKTHGDDSSAVLLDFSFIGYPGRLPQMMHFSFSSKKDWWSGSHMVIFSGNETSSCGCASVTPWRESPDISAEIVPSPGTLFSELEQIPFSDLGAGGKKLSINTGLGYGSPTGTSEGWVLLPDGSVVFSHQITFSPGTSAVYPWSIQVFECTGEPGHEACGTSSGPAITVFSGQGLRGAAYNTKV